MSKEGKIDLNDDAVKKAIEEAATIKLEAMYTERHEKETEGLVNKNAELLGEKRATKEKLDELSAKHDAITSKYDFESIDEQLETARKAKEDAMSDIERVESQISSLKEDFLLEKANIIKSGEESKAQYESILEKKTIALNKSLVSGGLAEAISEEGGYAHLLTDLLANQVRVVLDGDEYVARVMSGSEVRNNEDGKPMSIKELVQQYRADEKYGVCFQDSGASGGSASGSENNQQRQASPTKRSEMSFKEKSEYITKHSEAKYLALPE